LEKTYCQLFGHQKGVWKVSLIVPKTGFFVLLNRSMIKGCEEKEEELEEELRRKKRRNR
jgi:hypothetical protein